MIIQSSIIGLLREVPRKGCHFINIDLTENFQITDPSKVWVCSCLSVNRNGILASAIMRKLKNGHHFINIDRTEKFQITQRVTFVSPDIGSSDNSMNYCLTHEFHQLRYNCTLVRGADSCSCVYCVYRSAKIFQKSQFRCFHCRGASTACFWYLTFWWLLWLSCTLGVNIPLSKVRWIIHKFCTHCYKSTFK